MAENESFNYTYSANERRELERIRARYTERENAEISTAKIEKIRALDTGVTKRAGIISIILGTISTLLLGFGMSAIMTDIRVIFGEYYLLFGIAIGLVGIVGVLLAYPLYRLVYESERKRIAPEILRLTEEILFEN